MTEEERRLDRYEERTARRSCLAVSLLIVLGQLVFAMIDLSWAAPSGLVALRFLHAAVALAVFGWLRVLPSIGTGAAGRIFAALAAPFLPIFWMAEVAVSRTGSIWEPFVGEKLVMLGIALLIPGGAGLGAALVLLFAAEAVAMWGVTDLDLPTGEPWITLVVAAMALFLLAYRSRTRDLEREAIRMRVQADALEEIARVLLALRDRSNTPLQTLEVGVALLQKKGSAAPRELERMKRALDRLRGLSAALGRQPLPAGWKGGTDPEAALRRLEDRLRG